MENRLNTISTIYNMAQNRPVKFNQLVVKSNLIRFINTCYTNIRHQIGSNIEHSNLEFLDYDIRSIIFKYNLSLVPLSEHIEEEDFKNKMRIIAEEFRPFLTNDEVLDLLVENLYQLYSERFHIYLDVLSSIIKYGSYKYTIISKYKLSANEKSLINSYFKNFELNFMTLNEFNKNLMLHDIVIFIGSSNIYSPALFEHINAINFYFVYFDLYHSSLKYLPYLEHPRVKSNPILPIFQEIHIEANDEAVTQLLIEESKPDAILLVEPQIPYTVLNQYIQSTEIQNDKNVECKLLELENGKFIFEEIGQKAKCDTINHDYVYVRKHLDEMEIDDYLVIIQFNTWEDRKDFANLYFESSGILKDRANVAKIKKHLSKQIQKYGLERYTDHLNKKLNLSLKYYQINGLTKKESFHLRDKKSFYKLLKHFTQNNTLADKLFKSSFSLANFHQRIGHVARKELRNFLKVNPKGLYKLQDSDYLKIPNIEYLKIELFKIKNISTQIYSVPGSKVGTIIKFRYEEVYE